MCSQHQTNKKLDFNTPLVYFIVIALGILSGLSDVALIQSLGLTISEIFIKIFKCISLPIIALSIIVTLCNYTPGGAMRRIWQRTVTYTLTTTVIAAVVSCGLYLLINPANVNTLSEPGEIPQASQGYLQYLMNIIPANVFSPFLEHQVLGVLLVGMVVGLAIRHVPDEQARTAIANFFKGAHGIFLVVTKWVVAIIPVGLFGFITTTVIQLREGMDIRGLSEYLSIVVLANVIQGFIILPIWLKMNHVKPFQAMKGMLPALSIAFFSKSSAGTLPMTMAVAEKNLGVNPKISQFVLPLCTTINMNGCAAFIFATVIYLMQNAGIEISLGTMIVWIFIATVAAIGNAGVPMGCFFLSASLLASMNVPITLLGIILPFYSIIDMIETALNVWSDACVAKVVDLKLKAESELIPLPNEI